MARYISKRRPRCWYCGDCGHDSTENCLTDQIFRNDSITVCGWIHPKYSFVGNVSNEYKPTVNRYQYIYLRYIVSEITAGGVHLFRTYSDIQSQIFCNCNRYLVSQERIP